MCFSTFARPLSRICPTQLSHCMTTIPSSRTQAPLLLRSYPAAYFHPQFINLSLRDISQEECIALCTQPIKEWVESAKIDFSGEGLSAIQSYFATFNTAIDGVSCLSANQVASLKGEFNQEVCALVENKWAADLAEAFYNIPGISDLTERALAGQKWTDHYFAALKQLREWQSPLRFIPGEEVQKFLDKTLACFEAHSYHIAEMRVETLCRQMEKNPDVLCGSEKEYIESPCSSEKNDFPCGSEKNYIEENPEPSSGPEEEDYSELMELSPHILGPKINGNKELLKQCVWMGFTLQKMNWPYHNKEGLFQNIFNPPVPDVRKE
jgi:hypothetical protein